MSLYYLVKLEMLVSHMLSLICKKNQEFILISTVTSKFARFNPLDYSVWGRKRTARGVRNRHHWYGRTETVTENRVGQARSRCHCGSHSSVPLLIGPESMRNLSLGRRHIFALCDLRRYTSLRRYATIFCLGLALTWPKYKLYIPLHSAIVRAILAKPSAVYTPCFSGKHSDSCQHGYYRS